MPWIQVNPTITERVATVSHQVGACIKTQEELFDLRHYMGNHRYFKDKNFTFGMIACAINDWSLARHDAQARPGRPEARKPEPEKTTDDLRSAKEAIERLQAERAARKEKRA